jgi:hypothetical protein
VIIVADKRFCSHRGKPAYYTTCKACKWQLDMHAASWNEFAGNAKPDEPFDASKWEFCVRYETPKWAA